MKNEYDVKEPFNIKKASYELYKIWWLREHVSPERVEHSLEVYETYVKEAAKIKAEVLPYIDWVYESGCAIGAIWVSYPEFLENEYLDKETMIEIYDDDEILIEEYCKDREYELEEDDYDI